jgi:hypothetical protein
MFLDPSVVSQYSYSTSDDLARLHRFPSRPVLPPDPKVPQALTRILDRVILCQEAPFSTIYPRHEIVVIAISPLSPPRPTQNPSGVAVWCAEVRRKVGQIEHFQQIHLSTNIHEPIPTVHT